MGKKAFFLAGQALPADRRALVRRRNEGVVMFHHAIAAFAADRRKVSYLWIDRFHHTLTSNSFYINIKPDLTS
jgi:hypothetical protein